MSTPTEVRTVAANGVSLNVAVAGSGPAVLLLHGFPHTWTVWSDMIPRLAGSHTVIAPDLRGLGDSERTAGGYDAATTVADLVALLDALAVAQADVVGLDLGTPVATLLALTSPDRVRRLVAMEALVGALPGAEEFLRDGAPWWFGFHAVPGLAERVVAGNEAAYLDFFLDSGTRGRGVGDAFRAEVHRTYRGAEPLRSAFEYYRAFPASAAQIADAAPGRLTMPVMTVGAASVGDVTFRQLAPLADDIVGRVIADCGHIIPQDRPDELVSLLLPFLA
ncbi:alpha/beta fold hydrolase [Promicromonospora sp. NPDC057138]|uniref:alpha/beta fold hydrolase n=1 Tax=Promicromonospora sp. NPDC057138 TaxID=3346031 RepID=UPI003638A89E